MRRLTYVASAALALLAAGCADSSGRAAPEATPSIAIPPACASPAPRSLLVCPSSGPVGTRVVITGDACHDSGVAALMLTFERLADGQQPGAAEITRDATVGVDGRIAVEWVVPASVGPLQGSGGGPTTPGRYTIRSLPPLYPNPCRAEFRVT